MKRKSFTILLILTAALAAALAVLAKNCPALVSSLFAFPFEQVAAGLGALSRAGRWGNALAVMLWLVLSSIPAFLALCTSRDKRSRTETASLFLLSALALLGFYGQVNPSRFFLDYQPELSGVIRGIFGLTIWSGIILCVVLRLVRLFRQSDRERLLRELAMLLRILCLALAALASVTLTRGCTALLSAETGGADRGVGLLRLAAGLIPYLLDIAVILRLLPLLSLLLREEEEGVVEAAGRLSRLCCAALGLEAGVNVLANLVQIIALPRLTNVSVTADFPLVSLVLVLLVLLFARLVIENKRLRQDNSLFI